MNQSAIIASLVIALVLGTLLYVFVFKKSEEPEPEIDIEEVGGYLRLIALMRLTRILTHMCPHGQAFIAARRICGITASLQKARLLL